ncbi:MAG: DNA polymerase III subunit beta, partial [Alphaproteobacteria bacterium]
KLPDGTQVELESDDDGKLTLRSGRSTFTLACLPASDYPATDEESQPHNFSLTATELKGLVDHTRFAISTEETRYYLNGIYLHAVEQNGSEILRAVATDGHRLARFQIPLPGGAADIPGVIVPRKTIQELRKLLEDSEDSIDIALSDTKIRFAFDGIVLNSKLIDGTFPDYERVIPSGNDKTLDVDCKQFAAAVDRVSTISTEKSRAVKLALNKNNLTLSATSLDNGSAVEEIEVGFDAEPLEIGFNSRYLLDITQQIEGGHVQFSLADAASPTVVTDVADTGALYVLMPMRV